MKRLLMVVSIMVAMALTCDALSQPAPRPRPQPIPTMAAPVPVPAMAPVPRPEPAMAPVVPKPVALVMAPEVPKPKAEPKAEPKPKAEGKKDAWWGVLFAGLINVLLLFVLAIASGLGGLLIRWVAKKMKITDVERINQLEFMFNGLVQSGVSFAKQMAHKLGDDPNAKAKRLSWAVEFVEKGIEEWGLPKKTADWLKKKIEAKIGEDERK